MSDKKFSLPADHVPAIRVPRGGSSCSSCEYLGPDGKHCSNEYFRAWHGSNVLPLPADEYCSDWYEPKKGAIKAAAHPLLSVIKKN